MIYLLVVIINTSLKCENIKIQSIYYVIDDTLVTCMFDILFNQSLLEIILQFHFLQTDDVSAKFYSFKKNVLNLKFGTEFNNNFYLRIHITFIVTL